MNRPSAVTPPHGKHAMLTHEIPVVTVSYNSPELISGLLASFRKFYPHNPVHVIDGSEDEPAQRIQAIVDTHANVQLKRFGYNIHHGPGMAWAIQNLGLSGPVLFLDSDIVVVNGGFIEALQAQLQPGDYGVGDVQFVNRDGFNVPYAYGVIHYLHPACMLANVEVMRSWPMPVKHGAPMIEAMAALHQAGKSALVRHVDWVANDMKPGAPRIYIDHLWSGTVKATGGYHLDEWMGELSEKRAAAQPPAAPAAPAGGPYNADLLAFMPGGARKVLEVGCNTGNLAQAYIAAHGGCDYWGIEFDRTAAEMARRHCSKVMHLDVEGMSDAELAELASRDCWVFGDVLEHLRDPWRLLARIRQVIPSDGCIVASVPNAQHWSVQARLAIGDFRYADGGLMDRTHLRWFTRQTMLEMFQNAGFRVEAGRPRIFNEPGRERALSVIRMMAETLGVSPDIAVNDALPLQYVVRAVPA